MRRPALELPPFFNGVHRRTGEQFGSRGPTGHAVEAINVESAFGETQRRRGLRSFATSPPLLRPPGSYYGFRFFVFPLSVDRAGKGAFTLQGNQFHYFVGAPDVTREPFSGVYFADLTATGTLTRHQRVRFEYFNGTDWVFIPWILDQTESIVDGYRAPLTRPGGIYWRLADLSDWADYEIQEQATGLTIRTKWVRFRFADRTQGGVVDGELDRFVGSPGAQLVDLAPVNGLYEGTPGDSEALIVAGDRPERRGQELGANIGLAVESGRVEPGFLERLEETGETNQNDFASGDAVGVPIVGTGAYTGSDVLLRKLRGAVFDAGAGVFLPYRWSPRQFEPGVLLEAVTTAAADRVTHPFLADQPPNWLEHGRVSIDNPLLPDGFEYAVVVESSGADAYVYPDWAAADPSAETYTIRSPPLFVIFWDGARERASIRSNLEDDLELDAPNAPFGTAYPFKYYGRFSVAQEMRWAMRAGPRWVMTFNPATRRVLCANGHEVLETEGRVFRILPADNSSDLADILVGEVPEGLSIAAGEVVNAAKGQFRSAVPNADFVTFFQGRAWAAKGSLLYWSFPNQGVDIWPFVFTLAIRTSENSPITGLRVVGERLLVFTNFETHEVYEVDVHTYATRPVSQIGFVHQSATVVISNQGASYLAGVTPQGIGLWTGGEVQMILQDWADVVDEPVNASRLEQASAAYVSSTAQAFFAVPVGTDRYARRILVREIDTQRWWVWSTQWGVSELGRGTDANGRDFLLVGYETGFVATLQDDLEDDGQPVVGSIKTAPLVLPQGQRAAVTECLVTARVLGSQTLDVEFRGDENPQAIKEATGMRISSGSFVMGASELGAAGRPLSGATFQTQGYRTRGVRVAHSIQGIFRSAARWALRSFQIILLPRSPGGRRR